MITHAHTQEFHTHTHTHSNTSGTDTEELESGNTGSIVTLAGIPDAHVTDTLILKQEEDDEEIAVRSSVRARVLS